MSEKAYPSLLVFFGVERLDPNICLTFPSGSGLYNLVIGTLYEHVQQKMHSIHFMISSKMSFVKPKLKT